MLEQGWYTPNHSAVIDSFPSSVPHFHRSDNAIRHPVRPTIPSSLPLPPPLSKSHAVPSYPDDRQRGTPQPEHTRIPVPDFLDQDDDTTSPNVVNHASPLAPPPRTPNPELLRLHAQVHEKLKSELYSLTRALDLDSERLRAHQADLLLGEPAIKDEMARLQAVRDVCLSVADRTRQAVRQAEANIAELRRKGDPEVDELVCATNIVHNQ